MPSYMEGVHAEERWVMDDHGQVTKKLVDVTNVTKQAAFLDPTKVFETERAARRYARDICDALHVKFAVLRDEHDDWLREHPEFKLGDRVEKSEGCQDTGTVIAVSAKLKQLVVEMDDRYLDTDDFDAWIKIEG